MGGDGHTGAMGGGDGGDGEDAPLPISSTMARVVIITTTQPAARKTASIWTLHGTLRLFETAAADNEM